MTETPSRTRNAHPGGLWLLIAVLVFSNVVTAVAAAYLLGRLEERAVAIVEPGIPELAGLRELAKQSANAHRFMLATLLAEDPAEAQASSGQWQTAVAENNALLKWLTDSAPAVGGLELRQSVREAGEAYLAAADGCFRLLTAGRLGEARAWRIEGVRPAYEEYQARQARLAASVTDIIASSARETTTEAAFFRRLFLGLGAWPILARWPCSASSRSSPS